MRVVEYDGYGGPEVLTVRERPVPQPGPGQVLVRVLASGVNPKDTIIRSGAFKFFSGRRFPKSTGFDLAGEVAATGDGVTDLRQGTRVWGLIDGFDGGAAADHAVLPRAAVSPAPAAIGVVEAAALPLVGLTALQALAAARVQPGERVLVKGASGGVGSVVIQLAVAAGARVTAVAGAASLDHCRDLGAAEVVDYAVTDPADLPAPFDVVVDCYGASPFRRYRRLLGRGGRFVTVAPAPALLALQVLSRVLPIPAVRSVLVKPRRADLEALAALVDRGTVRMPVQATYPLDRIAEAHADVAPRHARGKRVVLVGLALDEAARDADAASTMKE